MVLGTKEMINRARGNDDGSNARSVVAENGDVAAKGESRDMEETVALGSVGGTTGIDEASATGVLGGVSVV